VPETTKLESKTETPSFQFSFKPLETTPTPTPASTTSTILATPEVLDAKINVTPSPFGNIYIKPFDIRFSAKPSLGGLFGTRPENKTSESTAKSQIPSVITRTSSSNFSFGTTIQPTMFNLNNNNTPTKTIASNQQQPDQPFSLFKATIPQSTLFPAPTPFFTQSTETKASTPPFFFSNTPFASTKGSQPMFSFGTGLFSSTK